MTPLPGRRPEVCLYLDPAASVLPDGTLAKFWGRFLVSFVRTFEQRKYSVVLDMADHPDPSSVVAAQGYVVVGTRVPSEISSEDVAFGQLLVAPGVDVEDSFLPSVRFEHDYGQIAEELTGRVAGEIWVVPREGEHVYVARLVAEIGVRRPVRTVSLDEAASVPEGGAVVSFSDDRPGVRALLGRLPVDVPVVLQSEPFESARPLIFLDMLGAQCGQLVASAVADVLSGGPGVSVVLPHRWVP